MMLADSANLTSLNMDQAEQRYKTQHDSGENMAHVPPNDCENLAQSTENHVSESISEVSLIDHIGS